MKVFASYELPDHSEELVRHMEEGGLSLVTHHGRPLFLTLPFDESLLRHGLSATLAARLFDRKILSLEQGARLAGMSTTQFVDYLDSLRIPVMHHIVHDLRLDSDAIY